MDFDEENELRQRHERILCRLRFQARSGERPRIRLGKDQGKSHDEDRLASSRMQWNIGRGHREGVKYDGMPVGTDNVLVSPPSGADVEEMSAGAILDGGADTTVPAKPQFNKKYTETATSGLGIHDRRRRQRVR